MKISPVTITTIRTVKQADRTEKQPKPVFITLEEAGLEESSAGDAFDCVGAARHNAYFWDGSSSEFTE